MAYKQKNNPFDVTSCGRRRTFMVEDSYKPEPPLKHMGYKVEIKRGKVLSEEERPHKPFRPNREGEQQHEEYHDRFPAKPFTDAEGKPLLKRKRKRKRKPDVRRTIGRGKNFNKAKSTGTGGKAGGGMTEKGVKEYRRKNPGSKLKTAVTTPPSKLKPGSKAAKRRKSFCARSKKWKSKRGLAARRRWNC